MSMDCDGVLLRRHHDDIQTTVMDVGLLGEYEVDTDLQHLAWLMMFAKVECFRASGEDDDDGA